MPDRAFLFVAPYRNRTATAHDITDGLDFTRIEPRATTGLEGHERLGKVRPHRRVDEHHRFRSRDARDGTVDVIARRNQRVAGADVGAGGSEKFSHGI